jgi:uncharacterized RDD family membrane protein YckC
MLAVLVVGVMLSHGPSARAEDTASPAAPSSPAVTPPEVGVIGAGETLWVYEFRHDADARSGLRFVFRSPGSAAGALFAPLPLAPMAEAPSAMAARGDYLHLFTAAGHQRLAARRALPVEPVPAVRFVELDLPTRTVPKLVAGDTPGDAVYAVVSPGQAVEIVDDARRRHEVAARRRDRARPEPSSTRDVPPPTVGPVIDDPESPETPPQPPTEDPAPAEAEDFGASIVAGGGDWFIARYAGAQWTLDRPAPSRAGPEDGFLGMAALGGQLHFFTKSSTGGIDHHVSASPTDVWREPVSLPTPTGGEIESIGWVKQTLVVVLRAGDGERALRMLTLTDGAWQGVPALIDGPTPAQSVGDPIAVGVFNDGLALAQRESRGLVQIGVWSIETGRQTEPYQTLFALSPPAPPIIPLWGMELIQIVVFLVIFGLMIAWRREAVATTAVLPPDKMLCPPLLRLLAFVLDTVILSPVWGLTIYSMIMGDGLGLTFGERMQLGAGLTSAAGELMLPAFGVIFAVYATVCEITMSATFGKRIVGAHVAGIDGKPCARWRILVRNFIRIIELALPGVLLLVMLTRNRQRFGDLAAGTIVVVRMIPIVDDSKAEAGAEAEHEDGSATPST